MGTTAYRFLKEIISHTPLRRYFFPFYAYNMTVPQLRLLCDCLDRAGRVPGVIVEVGCSTGMTTVFLNKYMDAIGIEKAYFAIDTFSGFVEEDVSYEVLNRGKRASFFHGFRTNKKKWFDGTMRMNGISRVRSIQADANGFDFSSLGPIALCLLDVDLYRPTRRALPSLFRCLSPGGIVAVDDCDPNSMRFDGAAHAYQEFCQEIGYPQRIVWEIGVIEKLGAAGHHLRRGTETARNSKVPL